MSPFLWHGAYPPTLVGPNTWEHDRCLRTQETLTKGYATSYKCFPSTPFDGNREGRYNLLGTRGDHGYGKVFSPRCAGSWCSCHGLWRRSGGVSHGRRHPHPYTFRSESAHPHANRRASGHTLSIRPRLDRSPGDSHDRGCQVGCYRIGPLDTL